MRTQIDYSKHQHTEIKNDSVVIHKFYRPDTVCEGITFINSCGIMAVTGDFGNWIFCREFHPSDISRVSDGYWLEKLQIASKQKPKKYSAEKTEKEIRERLLNQDGDLTEEEKEYYEDLLDCVDDEFEYTHRAYNDNPGLDTEYIPFREAVDFWLEAVFDGYEEMCKQIKQKSAIPGAAGNNAQQPQVDN